MQPVVVTRDEIYRFDIDAGTSKCVGKVCQRTGLVVEAGSHHTVFGEVEPGMFKYGAGVLVVVDDHLDDTVGARGHRCEGLNVHPRITHLSCDAGELARLIREFDGEFNHPPSIGNPHPSELAPIHIVRPMLIASSGRYHAVMTSSQDDRWTLGRMQNPVRGMLHGSAAVLSLVGIGFLVFQPTTWAGRIAVLVFGIGLVALYTTSSLYHSIPWRELWKKRMQRLDHSMIFVLIAASYTPVAMFALDGWLRVGALALPWLVAAVGISQQAFFPTDRNTFAIALMVAVGWVALVLMWPIAQAAGTQAVVLIAAGGMLYTVGMLMLVTNRPRLWPRVFSYHEAFHVLVVSASALHFAVTWRYLVPLGV